MHAGYLALSRLLTAGRAADAGVCRDGTRTVTWGEFSRRAGGVAAALARRAEERWLIHCEHPLEFAVSVMAALHAGRRAVVAPGLQPGVLDRLRPAFDGILGSGPAATLDVSRVPAASWTFAPLAPEAAALDFYTSGSSGEPKRIGKTLAQLETETQVLESCWGDVLAAGTIVGTVPHHHIYGMLFRIVWPLSAGRVFDAALCGDPNAIVDAIARNGDVVLVSGPAHLARLPDLIDLASLAPAVRHVFSSGGLLPAAAARAFLRSLGAAPTEVYGSTETGGIAWRRQNGDHAGTAWTPFPGVAVAAGEDGALRLRSPYLARAGWTTLDDAGELLDDGRFLLGDRLDRVVKIEGKRVSLPELEQRLREHAWVADAGVVALPGRRQALGAAVVLRADARQALQRDGRARISVELRHYLRNWFDAVALPRRWRYPDELPVNERGKVSATELARLFRTARDEAAVA